MAKYFTLSRVFSFITITALIGNIAISGISNSSLISFLIKLFSSGFLIFIFIIQLRLSKIQIKSFFKYGVIKSAAYLALLILAYLSVSLVYSSNPVYGAQKIINIFISALPNIIILYYLIAYAYRKDYKENLFIIISLSIIITLVIVVIYNPFDHSTIYQFSPLRWSHVFIGRLFSFLTLIILFYFLNSKERKKTIIYGVILTLGFYLTYLTGLRAALIGLSVFSFIAIIWYLFKKKLDSAHLYGGIIIFFASLTLVFITPQSFQTEERIQNLFNTENLEFGGDEPILTRVESYKLSWQMFLEKPLIGWGFGGFNGYNNLAWTRIGKYPHNIILEILCELGVVGLSLFFWLCYSLIRRMLNVQYSTIYGQSEIERQELNDRGTFPSHILIITFFFCLFLAMFSKDISTQGFLWLFIAFVGIGKKQEVV